MEVCNDCKDSLFKALRTLLIDLKSQPDEYVVSSKINKPYNKFNQKIYQHYIKHLKIITSQSQTK